MAGMLTYENDFIVDGNPNTRLSANFRVREFLDRHGKIHVHRELIAGLQILRNRTGSGIDVVSIEAPASIGSRPAGLGVVVKSDDLVVLEKAAMKLKTEGYFSRIEPGAAGLYLEIHAPDAMPAINAETAFDCGIQVTAAFETSGDPYQQVTGNFDGAGLSYGPIQCNLLSGTLQELFIRFRGSDENKLKACFGDNTTDYQAFWKVLDGSRKKAVAWGDAQSTGKRKHGLKQPWKGYLQAVGREPVFRHVMLVYAYDKYGKRVLSALSFLRGISPVRITGLRCLAALYDMCVQQGSLNKAADEIRTRVFNEMPRDEFALTRIVVEERAKKASPRWRADCLSRRLSILERQPVPVSMNGHRSRRANPGYYLLRNSPIKDLDDYLEG
jgi:hypothetical protein